MRATGIVRRIDRLGRVVIPKEVRKAFGIGSGVPVAIDVDGDRLVLSRHQPGCVFCGAAATLEHAGRGVCAACAVYLGCLRANQGDVSA